VTPGVKAVSYKPGAKTSADIAVDDPKIAWVILQVETALKGYPMMRRVAERLYLRHGEMTRPTAHRHRGELWDTVARAMERDARFDKMCIADAAILEVKRRRSQR